MTQTLATPILGVPEGGVAQWESTCFASRGSGVRVPSPPPKIMRTTGYGSGRRSLAGRPRSLGIGSSRPAHYNRITDRCPEPSGEPSRQAATWDTGRPESTDSDAPDIGRRRGHHPRTTRRGWLAPRLFRKMCRKIPKTFTEYRLDKPHYSTVYLLCDIVKY